MIPITLTPSEMWNACCVGVTRQLVSVRKGLDPRKNRKPGTVCNFQEHIEGAIAEACFAKFLGTWWSCSVNSFKLPDVGEWQVRSTTYANGHLIVRPSDLDHYRVALLTTNDTGAVLHGWMHMTEAKDDRFWRPDWSTWWVPQNALTPFEEVATA
jgi:hypothetical protein